MRPELPVLIKARAKIADPANWGKGIRGLSPPRRPLNTCCAAEAIEDTCDDVELRSLAFATLRRAAGILPGFHTFVVWNDAPERTHADVVAAYDRAIKGAS
jgi:hypothetical protein